jgi:hypothetical protein
MGLFALTSPAADDDPGRSYLVLGGMIPCMVFDFGSNALNLLVAEAAHVTFDLDIFFPENMEQLLVGQAQLG